MANAGIRVFVDDVNDSNEARIRLMIWRVENGLNATDGKPMPPYEFEQLSKMWKSSKRRLTIHDGNGKMRGG